MEEGLGDGAAETAAGAEDENTAAVEGRLHPTIVPQAGVMMG